MPHMSYIAVTVYCGHRTVKTGWQKLGNELSKLVEHHSDKVCVSVCL